MTSSNTPTWLDPIRTDGVVREPYAHPSALLHEGRYRRGHRFTS
ncbi:hypothetical protein ACTWPB_03275 [Nocardia sp. IBHARD005]